VHECQYLNKEGILWPQKLYTPTRAGRASWARTSLSQAPLIVIKWRYDCEQIKNLWPQAMLVINHDLALKTPMLIQLISSSHLAWIAKAKFHWHWNQIALDARCRCQMPGFRDFSSGAPPPHPRALHEAESQLRCSSMQSWPGRIPQGVVAALAWEKLPTLALRGRKREAPAQDYSKHITSSIYIVIGHLQQEGSDQGLCECSCCTIHLRYRHHLLGCGSKKQVSMLRSEGLGVPLGGSRGLGSASGGL